MFLPLFGGPIEPPKPKLIEYVIVKQEEPELKKPVTWQDNPQNCSEDQWIASEEPFYCIPRKYLPSAQTHATARQNSSHAPVGYYEWGWCTYGAWQLTGWAGAWGDAHEWDDNALRDGYVVSSTPIVGSIFVDNSGELGHVGVVVAVNNSTITVKDMNYSGFGVWTVREVTASKYVYIHP